MGTKKNTLPKDNLKYFLQKLKTKVAVVNNATLNIKRNNTSVGTFTANADTDVDINITVPVNTSDLNNDSGFITNTVNNLTNYYLTTQTYTKTEVDTLIGSITTISFQVVQTLPSTGQSNIIYLVPKSPSQTSNIYDEYIYISNSWELIGDTTVDLSNYYTKTETDTKISTAIDGLDVTGDSNISASKTIKSWSETDGKVSITTQDISITKSQVSDFPTIPTVNNKTITIQENGNNVDTFTLNQSSNKTIDIPVNQSYYGTCTDNGDVVAKSVTVSNQNFKLVAGALITVKFDNTNSATNVTLNVNGTGDKSIWYNASVYTSSSANVCGYANRTTTYIYDGTYWVWQTTGVVVDSNTHRPINVNGTQLLGNNTTAVNFKDGTNTTVVGSGSDIQINATDTNTTYTFAEGTTDGTFKVTPSGGTAQSVAIHGLKSCAYTESTDYATSSHTHGNIQNNGTLQTNDITIASGDKIVVTDASDSNKVARTSITFDRSTKTKALTPYGSWESFAKASDITNAINALDGGTISGTPSASKTLTAFSQQDGNVSATFADIAIANTQVSGLGTASTKNVPTSGNASTTQVVMGNDTRLTNARTPTSHVHGNITNDGKISSDVTIANNDKLLIMDASDSNIIKTSSVAFDGQTATKCLTQKGTWESFTNNTGTVTSIKVGSTSYNPTSGIVSLPAYPTVNNGTLTITQNGTSAGTFTANQSGDNTIPLTDENVKQTNSATNTDYRVLLSNGANDNTETKTSNKSNKLIFNPNAGKLTISNTGAYSTYPLKIDISGRTPSTTVGQAISVLEVSYITHHTADPSVSGDVDADIVRTTYPICVIGNNSNNSNNNGVILGSHNGTTIVGAGESSRTYANVKNAYDNENLYLTADGTISFETGLNNGSTTSRMRGLIGYGGGDYATDNKHGMRIETTNGVKGTAQPIYLCVGNNIGKDDGSMATGETNGNSYGILKIYGQQQKVVAITPATTVTADRTQRLQDKSGTIALTDDITDAINALDGGTIGTGGTGKTITSLSQSNGNISATFSNISITKSQVSDLAVVDATNDGLCPKFTDTSTAKFLRQDGSWEISSIRQNINGSDNKNFPILFSVRETSDTTTTRYATTYRNNNFYYNPAMNYLVMNGAGTNGGQIVFSPNENTVYFSSVVNGARVNAGSGGDFQVYSSVDGNYGIKLGLYESGSSQGWAFCPAVNNKLRLGSPSLKWTMVYAINGTINTSDRNEKENIKELDEFSKDFIMDLKPVSYKRIEGDRTHYGLIAQEVEETLDKFDLTSMDFGGLCKDVVEEDGEEKTIYGLRYTEFIAPLIKTVQLQQQEIDELKKEVQELKELIKK